MRCQVTLVTLNPKSCRLAVNFTLSMKIVSDPILGCCTTAGNQCCDASTAALFSRAKSDQPCAQMLDDSSMPYLSGGVSEAG